MVIRDLHEMISAEHYHDMKINHAAANFRNPYEIWKLRRWLFGAFEMLAIFLSET